MIYFLLFLSPVLLWSVIFPKHIGLWFGESLPVLFCIAVLVKTDKTFALSRFSYLVLYIGSVLILIGAHYSYSHVPLFDWVRDEMQWSRNNYDKVGHFFQGFTAVIVVREYFLRKNLISSKKWVNILAFAFTMSIAGIWEIIEWLSVVVLVYFGSTKSASQFLGAQGYYWDAQSDMFSALLGALIALFFFAKYHEKELEKLPSSSDNIV